MQLSLIDPRECPVATAEMLGDGSLRAAITLVRKRGGKPIDAGWPYVERLVEVGRRPAWLVDDGGVRFVVVNGMVFGVGEFGILDGKVRAEAQQAIARLDAVPA